MVNFTSVIHVVIFGLVNIVIGRESIMKNKSEVQHCDKCREESHFLYGKNELDSPIKYFCAKCFKKLYKEDPTLWFIPKGYDLAEK